MRTLFFILAKKNIMSNPFTDHPRSIDESYFKHFIKAFAFSLTLLGLSFKALLHSLFPFLYVTTTSDRIKELNEVLQARINSAK